MARLRKIDPRTWNAEKFKTFDPLEKRVWSALLTHPLMTPMGAGVRYPGVLDDILGNTHERCFRCQHPCTQHGRNLDLLDHLQNALEGKPAWLFQALLSPLANQQHRGLAKYFWDRVGQDKQGSRNVSTNRHRNLPGKVSEGVSRKVRGNHTRNQEQEQEGEQYEEQNNTSPPPSSSIEEPGIDHIGPAEDDGQYPWPSPEALVAKFNKFTPTTVPKVRVLSPARRRKAEQALKLFPDEVFWDETLDEYGQSSFLQGRRANPGHERFKADFDWLLTRGRDGMGNCVKVHDGKYKDLAQERPRGHDHNASAAHNLAVMEAFLKGGPDDGTPGS